MKKPKLIFLALLAVPAFPQMYAVTIGGNGGSGYTNATASITANNGCSTPPTLGTVQLGSGSITAIPVTYAGICTLGGTPPTISISGNGSGATATGVLLSANIAILNSPTVASDQNFSVQVSGPETLYRYECILTTPAARVQFYSNAYTGTLDRMPGTSQTSQVIWAAITGAAALQPLHNTAFLAGILTVYDGTKAADPSTALSVVEGVIATDCAKQQTNLNAWNPWANYGTFYNGAWTHLGVN